MRSVTLLKYDGDKYCDVVLNGISTPNHLRIILNLKAGYLYDTPQRMASDGLMIDVSFENKEFNHIILYNAK